MNQKQMTLTDAKNKLREIANIQKGTIRCVLAEAILLKKGIRRESWTNDGVALTTEHILRVTTIKSDLTHPLYTDWRPLREDLLATDWIIAPEVPIFSGMHDSADAKVINIVHRALENKSMYTLDEAIKVATTLDKGVTRDRGSFSHKCSIYMTNTPAGGLLSIPGTDAEIGLGANFSLDDILANNWIVYGDRPIGKI